MKAKTLDSILYGNRHYPIGAIIDVDEKDINKLEKMGAVQRLETTKVEINVIKNPIKVESEEDKEIDVLFDVESGKTTFTEKAESKPKRKYNKRNRDFSERR